MARRGGPASALAAACHPLPAMAVTVLLAGLVALTPIALGRAAVVVAAVLAGQLSIGWSNDALDAGRDAAVQRSDKPVAAGLVSRRTTWLAAGAAVVACAGLSATLGGIPLGLVLAGVACGWGYNLGLKSTLLSWLPYAVAFASLPAVATWSSRDHRWPAAWAMASAALFGVAAHLVNVLPDLRDDRLTGVRGLAHRLGGRGCAVAAPVLLAMASVVLLLHGSVGPAQVLVLAGSVVAAGLAGLAGLRQPGSRHHLTAVVVVAAVDLAAFAASGAALA